MVFYGEEVSSIKSHSNERNEMGNAELEMIYANSIVINGNNDLQYDSHSTKNSSVPFGRKPALPPKPRKCSEANIIKPGGLVNNACAAIFDRKLTPIQKDPAEMSLKERLALFEKNNDATLARTWLGKSKHNNLSNSSDQIIAPLISKTSIRGK